MSASQRLRAPTADGAILAVPPLADAALLLEANRRRLAAPIAILGRSLTEVREAARREAITAAVACLREAGEPIPAFSSSSLLLAGHQPELIHPGVWVKNFALHGLARRHGLTPLNLVVDHDTIKTTSLRVLTGESNLIDIPFDTWNGEIAYEERSIVDYHVFAGPGPCTALVYDYWEEVIKATKRTSLIGECFAAARRAFERRWGCHNLEVPTSRLCQTRAFALFAAHLLLDIDRFIAVHNTALAEYRRAHGMKSRNHPVPELVRDGDWREVPLWGWRAGQARRGRLFVKPTADALELRVGDESWGTLPRRPDDLIAAWPRLEEQGRKVRFRALTTTIFARLFLGDLFIHGIGGGKYDELTDVILQRFHGVEPPAYLILSATLHLPLAAPPVEAGERARLIRQIRHLHYQPDRYLANGIGEELVREKRAWVARQPASKAERRQRFQAILALNDQLRPLVAAEEEAARQRLAVYEKKREENALLRRRDFAACLYPEEKLRPFLTQFLD